MVFYRKDSIISSQWDPLCCGHLYCVHGSLSVFCILPFVLRILYCALCLHSDCHLHCQQKDQQ